MMRSVPVVGAPQPWPPPPPPSSSSVNATDNKTFQNSCTTPDICSTDCPQWCGYLVLPPPPPLFIDTSDDDDSSSSRISPLMAALIAVLAAAFLLLFYYTVVSRICRRRSQRRRRHLTTQILNNPNSSLDDPEIRIDPMVHDPTRLPGLEESFIRQITVFKYRRADGLIEGTDCAVCLSEFKEDESLRLMPNCEHAFHIPCIDTWLKSNSSCPLCRATMNPQPARSSPNPNTNTNPNPNPSPNRAVSVAAAMRVQSRNDDVVLVVREVDRGEGDQVIVCHEERERGEEEGGGCVDSEERESGEEQVRKGGVNRR